MEETLYDSQIFENRKFCGECFENYKFIDCEFHGCSFDECRLIQCTFLNCTFIKCVITCPKAEEHTQIQSVLFTKCQLIGIHWHKLLPKNRLAEPIKKLDCCLLKYNTFTEMNLRKFDFSGMDISDSMFSECQLTESSFRSCTLYKTEFFKCDIRKADFREASGYQIDLMSSKVKGARFSFPEVVRLLNSMEIKID